MEPSVSSRPPAADPAGPSDQTEAGPFVLETILDDSGWWARRLSRKKRKLIDRIEGKVRAILAPGERVRYLSFGIGVSFLESYFLGWLMAYLNRRAILLTDRRIILLQIDRRDRPGVVVSQVRYGCIRKVGRTLLGNTRLTLGDDTHHVFAYVPRRDRKFLQKLTDWVDRSMTRESAGWEDLCPRCYTVVDGRPAACPSCGAAFKSAKKAGLLSLVFPGLGDMYMGHRKVAIFEMLVAMIFWLSALVPHPEYGPLTPLGFLIFGAIIVVFIHGSDAVATWYIAKKGIYPA